MRLAVVCASGIGDALILHTISHAARLKGWEATTFSNHIADFEPWLPSGSSVASQPSQEESFSEFDAIFLQHDNSQKAFRIKAIKKVPVYTFMGPIRNRNTGFSMKSSTSSPTGIRAWLQTSRPLGGSFLDSTHEALQALRLLQAWFTDAFRSGSLSTQPPL